MEIGIGVLTYLFVFAWMFGLHTKKLCILLGLLEAEG